MKFKTVTLFSLNFGLSFPFIWNTTPQLLLLTSRQIENKFVAKSEREIKRKYET